MRLRVAIESLGYTPKTQWWGVGGSQEITHVELVGPAGQIEVDAETYQVRADGELLTCEPATVLPMAQRYFLF